MDKKMTNKWMNKFILFILAIICCNNNVFAQQDFLSQQKKYVRVRTAVAEKEQSLAENLRKNGFTTNNVHILIVAYKAEKQLEIYAKNKNETIYKLVAVYDICASSGKLGPKRIQGDGQVPEGFYKIDRFNPSSNFYLSLGINYPNQSDRKKSNASNLGGDIFIHGSCVTIGCLPMTDDKIKEIYLYAIFARNNGQNNIPVYIFPFRMTDSNFQNYKKQYAQNQELIDFWTNLKSGYDKFVLERKSLNEIVDKSGNYQF
jgi:murein L,D-transpeptidase YafK